MRATVVTGGNSHATSEGFGKVTLIRKTATQGDFAQVEPRIRQQLLGRCQPPAADVLTDGATVSNTEGTREVHGVYARHFRELGHCNGGGAIRIEELLHTA